MNFTPPTSKEIQWAISQTMSMTQASLLLKYSYNTFKKYAKQYGLFETNQPGKGIRKPKNMKINKADDMIFWSDSEARSFSQKLVDRLER